MAIEKMKSGKFKVNVYMGTGYSRYVDYANTEKEAEILELEAKLRKARKEGKRKTGDYTFEEVYVMWWKKKYSLQGLEEITLDRTETIFRIQILPHLGSLKVKKISLDIIEDFQILLAFGDEARGIKPFANYKICISYAKQVMKYALLKGYILSNPFDLLELPVNKALKQKKEAKRNEKYYSAGDIQKTLAFMKQDYGCQAYTLLSLIHHLGATKGELYPLAWEDIDFNRKTISLSHKLVKNKTTGKRERVKGMKNRYRFRDVPMSDKVISLLRKWKKQQATELWKIGIQQTPQQLLFTCTTKDGEQNQPLGIDWINNRLREIATRYDLPHILPHGLRHTFVSDMMNNGGADLLIVQSLVGHVENSKVTREVYGHANEKAKIEAIRSLEGYRENA